MTLKQLLTVLDCDNITICYAGFGERIYKGKLSEFKNEHYLNFYVTYLISSISDSVYVEIHENKGFAEDE